MWIYTHDGFFSAVNKDGGPDDFMVRARFAGDLEKLRNKIPGAGDRKIYTTLDADYSFRMIVTRTEWINYLTVYSQDLTYPNFKGTMTDDDRHDIYMSVWRVMRFAQEKAIKALRKTMRQKDPYGMADLIGRY